MTAKPSCVHSRAAASSILLFPYLVFCSVNAHAACTTAGTSTVCDSTTPNPITSIIGTGNTPAEDNRDSSAISLRDNANVSVQAGGSVSAVARNAPGLYGTGGNTIELSFATTVY